MSQKIRGDIALEIQTNLPTNAAEEITAAGLREVVNDLNDSCFNRLSDVPIMISQGGTGQITANNALNTFLPSQAGNSGKVLGTDGNNTSWVTGGGGGGGTPGGASGTIQYNNAGSFGGFGTWNGTYLSLPNGQAFQGQYTNLLHSAYINPDGSAVFGGGGLVITNAGSITAANLSGTNTGDQTNITGNAGTVTTIAGLVNGDGVTITRTGAGTAGSPYILTAVTSGGGTVTSVTGTTNRITVATGTTTPVIDIAATYVGQTSITTLGTVTTGVWNGTAIANANLANSTISGTALGSNLAALTATNTTLTFSGSYDGSTARTVGLNLSNANTWTGQQTFSTLGPIFSTTTATTVPYLDASKILVSSAVTPTELGYLSGVTSAIQTQINAKGSGTVTSVSGTASRITSTGGAAPVIDISATFEALLGKVATGLQQFAPTTSAQLAGVLSDETGFTTGALSVFNINPTIAGMTITDATNIVLNTTTGTKIGTATGQKLAFFNSTPVVQQTGNISTALSNLGLVTSGTLPIGSVTGLGTGVATALAINTGSAGAFVLFNGALGTPSSGTISTGVTLGGTTMTLGSDATGDIYYRSAGGVLTRLPIGSSTNILTVSGGLPAWAAASGGSAFSALTSSTNTTAAMVVGTGASLSASGSGTITATAIAVGGITGLGTGVATFLATPTSANLAAAVTNETGSGALVFGTSPTFTTSFLVAGTTSGTTTVQATAIAGTTTLTLPAATDTLVGKATTDTFTNKTYDTAGTGNSFSINGVAATANTGTGAVVRAASPTLSGTPVLGAANATSVNFGVNALSYYAENVAFTPTLLGLTTPGAPTYVVQTGVYSRIGNIVTFGIRIQISALGGIAGQIAIGGLPFTVGTVAQSCSCGEIVNSVGTLNPVFSMQSGTTQVQFFKQAAAGTAPLVVGDITATFRIWVSGSYLI